MNEESSLSTDITTYLLNKFENSPFNSFFLSYNYNLTRSTGSCIYKLKKLPVTLCGPQVSNTLWTIS